VSTRLYESIMKLWDGSRLADLFTGGIWHSIAPAETEYPYVVIVPVSNEAVTWTESSEIRRQSFQLTVYDKDDGQIDPVSKMGTFLKRITDVFDQAPLEMPNSSGIVLDVRRIRDNVTKDGRTKNVWTAMVEYKVKRVLPRVR